MGKGYPTEQEKTPMKKIIIIAILAITGLAAAALVRNRFAG